MHDLSLSHQEEVVTHSHTKVKLGIIPHQKGKEEITDLDLVILQ